MSKAKKTVDSGTDSQTTNPANNLPEVDVVDNTTTKSDRKSGANLIEQTENEEALEPNKVKTLQALRKHFDSFQPSGANFDESAKRAALKAAGLAGSIIDSVMKAEKKSAAEITTVDEFISHLKKDSNLYNQVKQFCGAGCLEAKNLVAGNNAIIYSSEKISPEYVEQTVSEGNTYYSTTAPITAANLIKSIQTYSAKKNAVAKLCVVRADQRLQLQTFARFARALMLAGTTAIELHNALESEIYSGQFSSDIICSYAVMMNND